MPFDALAELKAKFGAVLAPRPARRELRYDRLFAVLPDVLVEEDEIIEHPHHRHDRRYAALLKDRHAGWAVAMKHPQNAALLLGKRHVGRHHAKQQRRNPDAPPTLPHDPSP